MYVRTYVCMYLHTYVYMYVCIYVHTYVYIYVRTGIKPLLVALLLRRRNLRRSLDPPAQRAPSSSAPPAPIITVIFITVRDAAEDCIRHLRVIPFLVVVTLAAGMAAALPGVARGKVVWNILGTQ